MSSSAADGLHDSFFSGSLGHRGGRRGGYSFSHACRHLPPACDFDDSDGDGAYAADYPCRSSRSAHPGLQP